MVRSILVLCATVVAVCLGACSTHARAKSAAVAPPARVASTAQQALVAVPARANQSDGSPAVSIQPASAEVAPGMTVDVTVQAGVPAPGLGAWTIEVQYDPSVLSPTSCSTPQGLTEVCNASYNATTVLLAGISPSGVTDSQTLATITFTAAGGTGTSSPLSVTLDSFVDPSGASISNPATSSAQVTVTAPS